MRTFFESNLVANPLRVPQLRDPLPCREKKLHPCVIVKSTGNGKFAAFSTTLLLLLSSNVQCSILSFGCE